MRYETNYNTTTYYNSDYVEHENNEHNNNSNNNIEMNNMDNWRLQTLYTDTKHVYAAKTEEVLTCDQLFARQNRIQTHPSSLPVIVKDVTQPYTYYTMKSYGEAQDNNYYVNFDDHVNANTARHEYNNNNTDIGSKPSFDDSGCAKTYLCTLLGCFACCLFKLT